MSALNFSAYMTYDPASGKVFWLARDRADFPSDGACVSYNTRFAGKEVGTKAVTKAGKTYIRCMFMGKSYLLHRVIWFMHVGSWPDEIDHRDGDGTNNKLDNLENVSRSSNQKNRRRYKDRALPTGVSATKRGTFVAYIQDDKKRVNLGTFKDLDSAVTARQKADKVFGYSDAHGSIRPL